jgi:hypothetical protein
MENPVLDQSRKTKANLVRLAILIEHGGVWLDSNTILTENLNWL